MHIWCSNWDDIYVIIANYFIRIFHGRFAQRLAVNKPCFQIIRCLLWKQTTTHSLRNNNAMFHGNLWPSSFDQPSRSTNRLIENWSKNLPDLWEPRVGLHPVCYGQTGQPVVPNWNPWLIQRESESTSHLQPLYLLYDLCKIYHKAFIFLLNWSNSNLRLSWNSPTEGGLFAFAPPMHSAVFSAMWDDLGWLQF